MTLTGQTALPWLSQETRLRLCPCLARPNLTSKQQQQQASRATVQLQMIKLHL